MADELTIEVLRTTKALNRIEPEWDALALACGDRSGFCRYPFVSQSWARHRTDARNRLSILAIRRQRTLVAIVPLMKRSDGYGPSTLKWLDSKTPLYDDMLLAPDEDLEAVAQQVGRYLRNAWLVRKLKAEFVLAGSNADRLLSRLGADAQSNYNAYAARVEGYASWDEYLLSRSARTRAAYRRLHRRLAELGEVRIDIVSDTSELEAAIAWIFERKRAWVHDRYGRENWLSPAETESFFRTVSGSLRERGDAFAISMTCGGACIASMLAFRNGATLYVSKMAFDPAWGKFSPGWLLIFEAIKVVIAQKMNNLDFMIGTEPWKDRSADHSREVLQYRLKLPVFGAFGR
ncbi:GNAT family N-acetyltransferase [Oricola sp.]|uniref:GNAT family N-acetyltransferase n=1 Tax=Oricola sp. TaxID=1979950 RepID=UPI003BAC2A0E